MSVPAMSENEILALQNAAINGTPSTTINTQNMSSQQVSDLTRALTKIGAPSYSIDAYNIVVASSLFQLLVNQTV
ncbi:hypothetical protein SEA_LIZZ_11 [Streptomyces phage Lizz]|nr:hypothetical protein SEA_PHTOWN_11 [Streptomyces phage PHTowN]QYW07558.1 hypothetical protein SEA_LIZZ_11 [Streptomyces phage Lizz]